MEKVLESAKRRGDKHEQAYCHTVIGQAYKDIDDYETAIETHYQFIPIHQEIGDKALEGSCFKILVVVIIHLVDAVML